jgi:CheY-like chemotaxis protein
VESQGGTIRVESEIMQGSVFSFVLQFAKTSDQVESAAEVFEIDAANKDIHVLVVEDIALNQLLMKTLLDDFGFQRDIASNGKIAIEKLKNNHYDIILMDLQMPEMNGFEATEYIRNVMNSTIPIVALTADVTTADLSKCKAVGMNDYIAKPVDEKLLYNKIVSLISRPVQKEKIEIIPVQPTPAVRYTNLGYLLKRTKADPALMMEMIDLYLEQTPPLILVMKQSLLDRDWSTLHASVHKMIPSFSIMGMDSDFESMARKVQAYADSQQEYDQIHDLVQKLEEACIEACRELKIEYDQIKSKNHE